jgi:hypothetical protein
MNEIEKIESMVEPAEQIYVYACFLPPEKTSVIIKPGSDIDSKFSTSTHFIFPRLNSIPVNLKHVKKVEIKKDFNKDQSVFSDYKVETWQLYKKCFDYDMQFSKLNRLIRDLRQLEKVGEILVKYFGQLKN